MIFLLIVRQWLGVMFHHRGMEAQLCALQMNILRWIAETCHTQPLKIGTYTVVSKVAYLIGVPKRIFENEHEPPKWSGMKTKRKQECPHCS